MKKILFLFLFFTQISLCSATTGIIKDFSQLLPEGSYEGNPTGLVDRSVLIIPNYIDNTYWSYVKSQFSGPSMLQGSYYDYNGNFINNTGYNYGINHYAGFSLYNLIMDSGGNTLEFGYDPIEGTWYGGGCQYGTGCMTTSINDIITTSTSWSFNEFGIFLKNGDNYKKLEWQKQQLFFVNSDNPNITGWFGLYSNDTWHLNRIYTYYSGILTCLYYIDYEGLFGSVNEYHKTSYTNNSGIIDSYAMNYDIEPTYVNNINNNNIIISSIDYISQYNNIDTGSGYVFSTGGHLINYNFNNNSYYYIPSGEVIGVQDKKISAYYKSPLLYYMSGAILYYSNTPSIGSGAIDQNGNGNGTGSVNLNFNCDTDNSGDIGIGEGLYCPIIYLQGIGNIFYSGISNFYNFVINLTKLSPNL